MSRETRIAPDARTVSIDHFKSAIDKLGRIPGEKLEALKTHFSERPFIYREIDEPQARIIQQVADTRIHNALIDFVILEYGIRSKEDKEEYLRDRHQYYFDSIFYPEYIVLAISQDLDLGNIFPDEPSKTP